MNVHCEDSCPTRRWTAPWLGALLAASLAWGCGTETAGESIRFEASAAGVVESSGAAPTRFTTSGGWEVELSTARVMLGPLVFYGGSLRASNEIPLWKTLLGIPVAYAHPADDGLEQGPILGDVLDQYVIDLLSGRPTDLGVVPGVQGTLTNVELQLQPPGFSSLGSSQEAVAGMAEQTFMLEGIARFAGQELSFRAQGHLGEEPSDRIIGNVPANVELVDASGRAGRLMIDVLVDRWFDLVDFDRAARDHPDGFVDLMSNASDRAALQRGIRSRFAYSARWSTE